MLLKTDDKQEKFDVEYRTRPHICFRALYHPQFLGLTSYYNHGRW